MDWKWNQVKWCLALHENGDHPGFEALLCVCRPIWLCRRITPILHTNTNLSCLFISSDCWNEDLIAYIWSLLCTFHQPCVCSGIPWVSSTLHLPPHKCLISGNISKNASLKALGTMKMHKHVVMVDREVHDYKNTHRHKYAHYLFFLFYMLPDVLYM